MLSKKQHIDYWVESSQSDWESVTILFNGRKYSQSLFFVHLAIEKLCKALLIQNTELVYPPHIHDLIKLLSKAEVDLPETDMTFLKAINVYNLEGRYPDYLNKIHFSTTKTRA